MRRDVVLWGLIGALSFLVLVQGYELLFDERIDLVVKFGVAAAVGVVSAVVTWWAERWFLSRAMENGSA